MGRTMRRRTIERAIAAYEFAAYQAWFDWPHVTEGYEPDCFSVYDALPETLTKFGTDAVSDDRPDAQPETVTDAVSDGSAGVRPDTVTDAVSDSRAGAQPGGESHQWRKRRWRPALPRR